MLSFYTNEPGDIQKDYGFLFQRDSQLDKRK